MPKLFHARSLAILHHDGVEVFATEEEQNINSKYKPIMLMTVYHHVAIWCTNCSNISSK